MVTLHTRPGVTQPFFVADRGERKFEAAAIPLVFLDHRDDGCGATPYGEAARLGGRYPLITVHGGKPPESGPCEPLSNHGFLGKEAQTVDAIAAWILAKPFAKEIR
jgi:hypothetical protein